jgi:hypothetical protein
MFPGSRFICEKMNIVRFENDRGLYFTLFGKSHRTDGPAKTWNYNGETNWYYNNKYHREYGPAIELPNNLYKAWYYHGKRHKSDGPALIYENGYEEYYYNDKYINKK